MNNTIYLLLLNYYIVAFIIAYTQYPSCCIKSWRNTQTKK